MSEILYSPAAYGLDLSARNMPKPKARIAAQVGGLAAGGSIKIMVKGFCAVAPV